MKVDIFIVGAMKCGTTTLFDLLSDHISIGPCKNKEPEFFLNSTKFIEKNISNYHSLFEAGHDHYMEASIHYSSLPSNPETPAKIHHYNPDAKIVYIIRDPFERIESHHFHAYHRGYIDDKDIDQVLLKRNYLSTSTYLTQVMAYIDKFGKDNVLLLFFDDLKENMDEIKGKLVDFLHLDPEGFSDAKNIHSNRSAEYRWLDIRIENKLFKSPYKWIRPLIPPSIRSYFRTWVINRRKLDHRPKLNEESKKIIQKQLKNEIEGIEKLSGRDLSHWMH